MDAVLFGLAKPMFGAPADAPTEVAWPQPHKYNTDIDKAKAADGRGRRPTASTTTMSFDLGFAGVNEPICVLIQESLAQIGIKTTINKVPGANWRTELATRRPCRCSPTCSRAGSIIPNTSSTGAITGRIDLQHHELQSPAMDALIDGARAAAANGDKANTTRTSRASSISPSPTCRAFRCTSPMSTSRCRRISPATLLVPPPARLPRAGQGVRGVPMSVGGAARRSPHHADDDPQARSRPAIPSLIGVVIVTFLLTRALPGDPAAYFAGPAATPQAIERSAKLGLDKPLPSSSALRRRSRARQSRQFADHRPAGRDRNRNRCRPRPN
jgi:hypothetical protein